MLHYRLADDKTAQVESLTYEGLDWDTGEDTLAFGLFAAQPQVARRLCSLRANMRQGEFFKFDHGFRIQKHKHKKQSTIRQIISFN